MFFIPLNVLKHLTVSRFYPAILHYTIIVFIIPPTRKPRLLKFTDKTISFLAFVDLFIVFFFPFFICVYIYLYVLCILHINIYELLEGSTWFIFILIFLLPQFVIFSFDIYYANCGTFFIKTKHCLF